MEKLCGLIWADSEFKLKWLLGGVIGSVPLLNLLVLGYFLRYARSLRREGGLALPAWGDGPELLLDTARMSVLFLVYAVVPVGFLWGVSALLAEFFELLWLDFLGWSIAWIPFAAGLAAVLPLWMAAVHRYLPSQDWSRALDVGKVLSSAWKRAPALVFPTLAFWGVCFLGWPLYGFAVFLALGPYVAFATAVFEGPTGAEG